MQVDLTERELTEQQALQLAARLTDTLDSITDGFCTLDHDWRLTHLNGETERTTGRPRQEMLGRVLWEVFPQMLGTPFEAAFRRAMNEGVAVTAEAHLMPWNAWFSARAYPSESGLTLRFREITAERAARQQLLLLQACVSQLNDMVLIIEQAPHDAAGRRIRFVNDAVLRCTGYSRDEMLGRSPDMLSGPQTDLDELKRMRAALGRGEPARTQLLHYRKDGAPFWVDLAVVPVDLEGQDGCTHFVSVERDITERKRDQDALRELNADLENRVLTRTAELNLAREQADRANRAKSEFLATMSHEIRTPMNGVMGMIDVLHQTSLNGYQVGMVDLIRDSADTLLAIIDDILDFSKIEAGKLQIEHEPVNLANAVEKVCALLDHMATKRGVRLTVFVDPAIPRFVSGDETRLRQVLVNLCGNAIKFSSGREQAGEVSVRVVLAAWDAQAAVVDLIVADNGIGIDDATLARLFTRFSQADASTTRRFGGSGLGLAITATLVRLMGGEISVRSAPGQGSTFSVRLHFATPADVSALADQAAAAASATAPAEGLQCRIVGSEAPLADDLRAYLEHVGAAVTGSPDLAAAAAATPAPGLWLWLVLPDQTVPDLPSLRAMVPAGPDTETRFVVLGRGARRRPRVEAVDLVTIDADALFQRTLLESLALAAGRLPAAATHDHEDAAAGGLRRAPQRQEARLQGRLLLVAEDNETNRAVITRQLELVGFAADVVVNGREALARWRSGDYALLLTDVHMPEMDGYALATTIRAEEAAGQRRPILALTASASRDEERRCRAAGMDGCLTKPIRLERLKAALEDWLDPSASTPSPAAAPLTPVDLNVLIALIGNDPARINTVLRAFQRSAGQLGQEMRQGVAAGSAQTVAAAAHKLKSAARSIGAERLGEMCAAIEQRCQAGGNRALLTPLPCFEAELDAVQACLQTTGVAP